MSIRRSRFEIMLEILAAVRGGEDKPTRIMYAVNLSWIPTSRLLSSIVEQGLLEMRIAPEKSRKRYMITEKGINVIDYFIKAREILPRDAYLARASPEC
ncbi:MAG: hypothetical protein NWE89_11940 [Candidatus Bathyarchaeota archaeon]|nr:hypothetical protein [Candidatus Bathyarchaeota archaeon]